MSSGKENVAGHQIICKICNSMMNILIISNHKQADGHRTIDIAQQHHLLAPRNLRNHFPQEDCCHPGNLPEIPHQDKVFLVENPECLTVEQGKRGGCDGKIKINLQLLRSDDSSTIINNYSKSFESLQSSVAQTGARTYIPCTADSRIENDSSNHHSTNV